ncbi:16S rRNA (uracil(1498)-N(3))-methyltransferase [Marinobacterium arenosum]|uniref:16S rRNA (uracil(1498)-N(3))-methyltransferase n=1 Tax=Marinobacterium arenosum TaxID=2862496 RepID=UPI001C96DA07|nr:16S rRNA (uracil(1498)-N(3))-methyltransferase [Marinobacterium arenosum]MBY4678358.1 16S rRNA (uracil(1498)-N(3))-methyltransferase [Marinobacterium arenosum]
MRIPRFYHPGPLQSGSDVELADDAVQHIARVLRMRAGESIQLFNGDGVEYDAILAIVEKRRVSARVEKACPSAVESPLQVHIGQSISRGERMDFAVQKATELGMRQLTPLFSERCEVKLNSERQDKRQRHWQQVAVSACEQSGRSRVPEIQPVQNLADWCQSVQADLKLVLHHHTAAPLGQLPPPASVALLIGPEGGLSDAEVELAQANGFQPVALGPRVMRTETAPVAALSILHYLWGDMAGQQTP